MKAPNRDDTELTATRPRALAEPVAIFDRMAATGRLGMACAPELLGLLEAISSGTHELARLMTGNAESQKVLEHLRDRTARAGELARMLLQLGRGPAASDSVDLIVLVEDLRRVLTQLVAPHGRLVVIRRGDQVRVAADRRALDQALFNLVARAADSARDGRVTVEAAIITWTGGPIASGNVLPAGRYASLTVTSESHNADGTDVTELLARPWSTSASVSSVRLVLAARLALAAGGGLHTDRGHAPSSVRLLFPVLA